MEPTNGPKYIALSLSFCISEIVRGLVNIEDVIEFQAGTAASSPEGWDSIIADYREYYWRDFPDEAERIARYFIEKGLVKQPRLEGEGIPLIGDGHWRCGDKRIRFLMSPDGTVEVIETDFVEEYM